MRALKVAPVVLLALPLIACGNTKTERGITGAGLGAAGGAMIGAVSPISVLSGAIIGTGLGGAIGLLTDKNTLDIGDPIWGSSASAGGGAYSGPASASVADTQARLRQQGYDPGPIDGVMGPRTRAALSAYQRDHGTAP